MEKVIESFKSLYRGENVVKKHLLIFTLLIIPTIASSIFGLIDDDHQTKQNIILLCIGLGFFIIGIVPMFMLFGFVINFINDRIFGKKDGIPSINIGHFLIGLKALPLYLVWGIYWLIIFGAVVGLAFIPVIFSGVGIAGILLIPLFMFLAFCIVFILAPFASYIIIQYSKKYEYSIELFNPLTVVEFIKKAFKPTIITALKYVLVGIIGSIAGSMVCFIIALILVVIAVIIALIPHLNHSGLTPIAMGAGILFVAITALVQSYISSVVGLAYWNELIEVYKKNLDTIEEKA